MLTKKLLVIDDEISIRMILENYLKSDYEIVTAADGVEGMKLLEQKLIPDLILHDIQMPNMDGFEFIKQIRASNFYKSIPLITLSGVEKSEDRIKCLELGSDDYIVKPFNPAEVKARISNLLKRYAKS